MTRSHRVPAELREKVRRCLLYDWDPIGVRHFGAAADDDEYDSYVNGVCQLLLSGADTFKLRKHLAHTETVNMGMSEPSPHLDEVVLKLLTFVNE